MVTRRRKETIVCSCGLLDGREPLEPWAPGSESRQIAALFTALAEHPLDPAFEEIGDFADEEGRFFGDFFDVAGAFSIDTIDTALIERLTAAIRANQTTPAYEAAKAEQARQRAEVTT